MQIIEVNSPETRKAFLDVPRILYKNDPIWVCPLNKDIESVFDPAKNNFHSFGICTRWILKDDKGHLIGRISAFVNKKKAFKIEQPTGGCGFFECIDNQQAADLLFDTAKNWMLQQGMKAMDGPVNFGENDMWWGLLVEGFTRPYYGMNYNPPYYKRLFEHYGFKVLYEQISNKLVKTKKFPERFYKIANWVMKKPDFSFEHLDVKNLPKFTSDFKEIYNDAWQDFENFTPITDATMLESFEKMKPIMDQKMIWFAYVENEPAAFVLALPDTNELIKGLNGRLDIIGGVKFLWNKYVIKNTKMRAVIMGTKKKYQRLGLESALFVKLHDYVFSLNRYEELELSWVGDFNKQMIALHEATGATFAKKHLTYRIIF
jgi:hypothetical protein